VPNNMGIILSGDFNPDEVIAKIDKDFSYMKEKPVVKYFFSRSSNYCSNCKRGSRTRCRNLPSVSDYQEIKIKMYFCRFSRTSFNQRKSRTFRFEFG
jgi:hypothetical protein